VTIEIRLIEIEELACRGFLSPTSSGDDDAVTDAIHRFLDETLHSTERRATPRAG
jgi:hypothetical protein